MSTSRKFPVLAIIAIIVLIISGILQLIALATPYWHTTYSRGDVRVGHGGIWHGCFRLPTVVYCSPPTHIPGWLMAVRILEVIGMMFMSGALMMMVIFLVVSSVKWSNITRNSAAASALISGLLSLIGDIIFGITLVKSKDVYFIPRLYPDPLPYRDMYTHILFWGFGMSVTAAIFCVISGILVGVARKRRS